MSKKNNEIKNLLETFDKKLESKKRHADNAQKVLERFLLSNPNATLNPEHQKKIDDYKKLDKLYEKFKKGIDQNKTLDQLKQNKEYTDLFNLIPKDPVQKKQQPIQQEKQNNDYDADFWKNLGQPKHSAPPQQDQMRIQSTVQSNLQNIKPAAEQQKEETKMPASRNINSPQFNMNKITEMINTVTKQQQDIEKIFKANNQGIPEHHREYDNAKWCLENLNNIKNDFPKFANKTKLKNNAIKVFENIITESNNISEYIQTQNDRIKTAKEKNIAANKKFMESAKKREQKQQQAQASQEIDDLSVDDDDIIKPMEEELGVSTTPGGPTEAFKPHAPQKEEEMIIVEFKNAPSVEMTRQEYNEFLEEQQQQQQQQVKNSGTLIKQQVSQEWESKINDTLEKTQENLLDRFNQAKQLNYNFNKTTKLLERDKKTFSKYHDKLIENSEKIQQQTKDIEKAIENQFRAQRTRMNKLAKDYKNKDHTAVVQDLSQKHDQLKNKLQKLEQEQQKLIEQRKTIIKELEHRERNFKTSIRVEYDKMEQQLENIVDRGNINAIQDLDDSRSKKGSLDHRFNYLKTCLLKYKNQKPYNFQNISELKNSDIPKVPEMKLNLGTFAKTQYAILRNHRHVLKTITTQAPEHKPKIDELTQQMNKLRITIRKKEQAYRKNKNSSFEKNVNEINLEMAKIQTQYNKLVKEIKPTLPKLTMEQELEWLQQQKQQKAQQQQEAEQQKAAAIQKQQDPKSEKLREQLSQNYVDKLTQINLAIEKLDNYKTMFPQAQKLINQLSSDRNSLIKQQNTLLESEKHYNEFSHKVEENSINSTADNITASANKIADKITTSVNDDKITELGNELEKICTQELEIYNAKKQIDQDFERNFHKYRDNISQNKQAPQLNEKLDIANISEKMQIRINSEKKEIEKAAQGYTGKDLKGHLQEARAALNLENWWQKQQQAINETILSTNELQDIHDKGQKIIELYDKTENIGLAKHRPLRQVYNIYKKDIENKNNILPQKMKFFKNAYNKFANPHTVEQQKTKAILIKQWNTLEQVANKMNLVNIEAVANSQKEELSTIHSSKIDGHKEPNEKALKAQYESAFSSLKKSGTELFKQIESSQQTVNDVVTGVLSKEIKENFQKKFDNIYAMSEVIKENIQDYQVANAKLDQLSKQLPELDQNIDALKEQQQNLVSQLQELGEQVEKQQQSKSSDQQKMSKEDYKKWQEKWGKVVKQFEKSLQLEPSPDIQQSKPMVPPPVPDDAIINQNELSNKIDEKDEVLTIAPNEDIIPEGKEKEYLEKSGLTDNKDLKDIDNKPKPIPPIKDLNFKDEHTYQSPPDDIGEINEVDQIKPKGLPTIDASEYDLDKDGNPLSPEQQKISDVLKAAMEKAVDKPWLIDIPDRAKQFFNDEIFNKLNDTLSTKEISDLKNEINSQIDKDWDNKVSSTVGKFKAWVYKMDKKYNIGIYGTKSKITGQIRETMKNDINNLIKENIEDKLLSDAQRKVIKTDNSAQQPDNPTHVQNINKNKGQDGPSVGKPSVK